MIDCRECKYCEHIVTNDHWLDHCKHPDAVFTICTFEREPLGSVCGEKAKLFEKKD